MKHSTKQRILSLLVSIAMVLTFVPTLMITTVADPDASNPNFWNFRAELDDPACDDPCEIPDPACELTGGTPDSCPGDDTCVNYDAGTSFCGDPDDCDGGPCPGDDTCPDFTVGTGACNDGCVAGTPGTWTCGNADDCTQADPCMIEDPDCGEPCTITGLGDNVELVVINTDNANNRYLTLEGLEIPDNFADADTIQLVFALDGSQASTNRGVTVWTDLMDGATIGLAADADQGDAIYAQSTGGTSIVVELPVTALVDGADEATEINVAFSYNNNASGFDANGRVGVSPVRPLHVAFMNSAISATLTFAFEFTCDSDICCVVCCDYDGIECTVTACECCLVCEETICECCAICLIPCAGDNTSLCYEVCEFDRVGGTVANPHPTAERGGGSIIHGFTNANVVNVDEDHPHRGGVRFNINELVAGTNVCVSDVAGFTFGATADNSATDTLQIVPLIQTRDADDEIVTVNPGVTYCTSGSLNVGRIWMGRPAGFGAGTASAFGTFFNGTTLDETPGFTEPGSNANHPDDPATFVNGADDYLTITFRANQPRYNRHKVTSLTLLDSEGEELGTVVWRSSDNYGGWSAFFSSVDCEVCDDCDFGCLANDVDQHFRSICGDGTCNSPCCSDCSECPSCGDGGDLETREVTVIYPTCSQYGVANVECAFCFTVTTDDDGDDVTVVIPALGPNVPEYPGAEWTTVAPTCLEDGYRWALCLGYNDNGDCDCCVGDATNGGNGTTNGGNGTTNGGNGTTNGGNGTTNGGNGGTDAGIAPTNSLITDTDDLVELGYYWTVDTFTQVEGEGRRDLQSYFDGIVPVAHEIVIADGRSSVTAVRVTWEVPATVTDPVVGVNFVTNDNVNGWAQTTMTYDAIVDDAEFVFEVEVDEYPVMEFFQIMLYSGTAVMPTGVTALVELLGDDDDANGSNGGTDNGGNGTDNGGNGTTNGGNGTDNGGNGTTNGGN
ncbi:MAG: hypothetical protein FWF76_07285, partial [Oscillospiraceae bacterium]|nr:hypothetical protein [Oscillospiraceae bacterium]